MTRRGGRERQRRAGPSVRVVAADDGRRRMLVDGLEASVVDRADPTHLDFPYMRWIADVLDVGWRAGEPLRAVHVGAGGCVLARYLAATRPGSDSEAYEADQAVMAALMCRELTKLYEENIRGTLQEVSDHFLEKGVKGEIVIVLEGTG